MFRTLRIRTVLNLRTSLKMLCLFQICSEFPLGTGEGAGDRKITLTQAIFHISILPQPDESFQRVIVLNTAVVKFNNGPLFQLFTYLGGAISRAFFMSICERM
jgi:hypothetical protein